MAILSKESRRADVLPPARARHRRGHRPERGEFEPINLFAIVEVVNCLTASLLLLFVLIISTSRRPAGGCVSGHATNIPAD